MYEPVRRSLRQLGIKPDTKGFPYYSPKSKTPRKGRDTEELDTVSVDTVEDSTGEDRDVTPVSTHHAPRSKIKEVLMEMEVDNVSNKSSSVSLSSSVRQLNFTSNKLTNKLTNGIELHVSEDEESFDSNVIKKAKDKNPQIMENSIPSPVDENCKNSAVSHLKTPQHGTQTRGPSPLRKSKASGSTRGQSPSLRRSHSSSMSGSVRGQSPLVESILSHEDSTHNRGQSPQKNLVMDKGKLVRLYDSVVQSTSGCTVEQLLQLDSTMNHLVFRHRMNWDRTLLLEVSCLLVAGSSLEVMLP